MAQSMQGYVWAAPLKRMPVQPACAPTYARGWQLVPVPVRVTRRTFRVVGSPVPAPFMVTRRTLGVVVKPARVVVSAAAPTHLPHLLGSAKAPAASHPVKGPPKAGVGEPAETSECERMVLEEPAASNPMKAPPKAGIREPAETCDCERKEAATPEASAPASEMVHPKGRPVSYGPASPFLKIEEGADDADTDEPKAAPKPAPNPAPEPAELTKPPQEAPEELPGQAEALEALKALMAELGGMGFKVPKKPTGEPEVAKAPGHPMFPTFRQFRNGAVQYIINVSLDDGRDELFLFPQLRQMEQ
ncbi:unnamed protein product [Symbiodinium natans]|uniref:Uncharacterized protein n=1 Tax=Symbiodinium natans TaxID=878477 RepID=A0A812HVZ4_9DINO|nr:unnamed protein product [Symbiodinium natans]